MEYALEAAVGSVHAHAPKVLILVLMEYALEGCCDNDVEIVRMS